jgi:hypothetical protein
VRSPSARLETFKPPDVIDTFDLGVMSFELRPLDAQAANPDERPLLSAVRTVDTRLVSSMPPTYTENLLDERRPPRAARRAPHQELAIVEEAEPRPSGLWTLFAVAAILVVAGGVLLGMSL